MANPFQVSHYMTENESISILSDSSLILWLPINLLELYDDLPEIVNSRARCDNGIAPDMR